MSACGTALVALLPPCVFDVRHIVHTRFDYNRLIALDVLDAYSLSIVYVPHCVDPTNGS